MSEITSTVRIAVVLPGDRRGLGGVPPAILEALDALGPGARIDVAEGPARAHEAAHRADLVVVLGVAPEAAEPVLAQARAGGPPVVAVVSSADEAEAVEWFRRGAADCVAAGEERALAAVAMEQICRARESRERRAVERRLAWLEHLNGAIVNENPAALAVLDADDRVVLANPAFARGFGEVRRGRRLDEVLPNELLRSAGVRAMLERVRAGRNASAAIGRASDAGGQETAYDVRAARLDERGRILLVLADVTEREALTRRIEDLRRYHENIVQNLASALLAVDGEGMITFANEPAAQILGEREGDLRGRSAWRWFPAERDSRTLLARTLAEGVRFRGAETTLTRADGSVVPIGMSCAPLVDADGTRLGAVAIFQDLSEITLLQRQVVQAEKMASIGQLAAGVAHEINNPMGFIHANLFQMAEYLADVRRVWGEVAELRKAVSGGDLAEIRRAAAKLEERAREEDAEYVLEDFAKAIRESQEGSERIRHIVRDLRDFSRAHDDEAVEADVNQCLDSTANIVWSMMKHSVVLRKHYADLPKVRCQPMQLKQVFMNLLVNAYQAIEERIGAGAGEPGEIELVTARRGEQVVISVSDTGAGIPPENLDRIFDPFFTTKPVGVGLGLSTSYHIVRKHGGTLRASNRQGLGACFEVILPLSGSGEGAPES